MSMKNYKSIGYKNERVILSDVLPYEVPPFFTNRYFYNFLIKNKVKLLKDKIVFKKDKTKTIENIIKILFGIRKDATLENFDSTCSSLKLNEKKEFISIPFKFKIAHKDSDFRELSVIHPFHQLAVINFYEKYRFSILGSNEISRFSLRKTHKISSLKIYKDSTHKKREAKNSEFELIETSDKEYKSLKTYFTYYKYSNIYQFYESYEFQRAEKKFDNLLKFDISRCFDSIYTHSITWALANKEAVKENLESAKNRTFGGDFDSLMQKMNYNETNGIVIGPEFSRIFAEIILQRVDLNVEKTLLSFNLKNKIDYLIYRYVDDYFVFFNDVNVKAKILSSYKLKLMEYNLYFNESKTVNFEKPIITSITKSKESIRKLIAQASIFSLESENESSNKIGITYKSAKDIITNYKAILSDNQTSYKDLQNYFLATIFEKLKSLIEKLKKDQNVLIIKIYQLKLINEKIEANAEFIDESLNQKKTELNSEIDLLLDEFKIRERKLIRNFKQIIELSFFIYSVLPRVSYSIKLCHILYRIIDFIKSQEINLNKVRAIKSNEWDDYLGIYGINFDNKHEIYRLIFEGVSFVLKNKNSHKYLEVESLYLLPIISELGAKHYLLSEDLLLKQVFEDDKKPNVDLSYFTIISLLNHIKINPKYNEVRLTLQKIIEDRFNRYRNTKAEDTFLLIDVLTCPYIANTETEIKKFRKKILESIKFFDDRISSTEKDTLIENIINFGDNWFYAWTGSDFGKELNTKRGHEVY